MIVITGASDGLGLAVAKLYKEEGKTVVNISRQGSEAADVNICLSLAEGGSVKEAAKRVMEIEEPLEALIQCAGVVSVQPLAEVTEEEIDRTFDINVKAQILFVSQLAERIETDQTDIVNISSTVGLKAYPDEAAYGPSKWAVRGFSQYLQLEFKGKPNRVISFCPGGFKSKLFEKSTGIDNTNEGNWMAVEDVARALKQTLDLPKNMEVSEIVINRK